MRRLHLFEFGDQPWLPRVLRDAETAYIATSYRLLPVLSRRWAEKISSVLQPGAPAEILDLCSGSGGAMPSIIEELARLGYPARATLTDLYPNPDSAPHPRIAWMREPVDAAHVRPELAGVRTMFSAFHHFRPDAAKAILRDAFDHRVAICIFESGSDSLLTLVAGLGHPITVLALIPFARPFRWGYLVFTWLVPVTPVILFWDVIVSWLRIYSPDKMKKLTEDMRAPDYAWDIGRISVPVIPGGLPYLIGRPNSFQNRAPLIRRGGGSIRPVWSEKRDG